MGYSDSGPRDQRGQAPAWLRYWQKAAGRQVSRVAPATSKAGLPWTPPAPRWQHVHRQEERGSTHMTRI